MVTLKSQFALGRSIGTWFDKSTIEPILRNIQYPCNSESACSFHERYRNETVFIKRLKLLTHPYFNFWQQHHMMN